MRRLFTLFCVISLMAFLSTIAADDTPRPIPPMAKEIHEKLAACIDRYHRGAKTSVKERDDGISTIAAEWNVREFMVYPISKGGSVLKELVREKGPDNDGLIIKILLPCGQTGGASADPYGERRKVYWFDYFNEYLIKQEHCDKSLPTIKDKNDCGVIRVYMSYGNDTDNKLRQEISDILSEYGTAVYDDKTKKRNPLTPKTEKFGPVKKDAPDKPNED